MGMISDGTSNTFLCGEKYAVPDFYANGDDTADSGTFYDGDDDDQERGGWNSPMQDTPGFYNLAAGTQSVPSTTAMFGSALRVGPEYGFLRRLGPRNQLLGQFQRSGQLVRLDSGHVTNDSGQLARSFPTFGQSL